MDDGVAAMLRTLNDAFPPVERMSADAARAAVAARRQPVSNVEDATAEDRVVDTGNGAIAVRIYHPQGTTDVPRPAVVFLHGGGFVLCDIESHDGFCRAMSRRTGSVVVSVDYRRAPEHQAPAAAWDAYAAFDWVAEHTTSLGIDAQRIAVAGDSAGGNLATVVAQLCRDRDTTPPAMQVLLYPMIDPACDTASYQRRATGYFTTAAALQWYWRQYYGDANLPEPAWLVAPGRADSLTGLPPAIVVTATLDPLHDDGVAYARRLRDDGVSVVHRDFRGLFHGFLTMLDFPPAVAARDLLWSDMRELMTARPAEAVR